MMPTYDKGGPSNVTSKEAPDPYVTNVIIFLFGCFMIV